MKTTNARDRAAFASSFLLHAGLGLLAILVYKGSQPTRVELEIRGIEIVDSGPAIAAKPAQAIRHSHTAAVKKTTATSSAPAPAAVPAPVAAAAHSGSATGNTSAITAYLAQVREKLSDEIHPPEARRFLARPLTVTLEMTLESNGSVKTSAIRQSSGSPEFDRSVTEALRRASPFQPFSAAMGTLPEVTVRLPVEVRFH